MTLLSSTLRISTVCRDIEKTFTPVLYTLSPVTPPERCDLVRSVDVALALGQWGTTAHSLSLYFYFPPSEPSGLQLASECQH